jgi:hypothetical protein
MKLQHKAIVVILLFITFTWSACKKDDPPQYPDVEREDVLPGDIAKRGPETDQHPPVLHTGLFDEPVPLDGPINTSGAEDSPFILPDGNTLYFFFTPDVRVPAEQQILDNVSGVWVSEKVDGTWTKPERVWLEEPGKLALDGAVCVQGDEMWFASAREGFNLVNMFTAQWMDGKWSNWQYAGDRLMREIRIGEVHLFGDTLYFHSAREGSHGGFDLWKTWKIMNEEEEEDWHDPVNITVLNSGVMDGYPFVTSDGQELWYTRTYQGSPAVYKSVKADSLWGEPELMVSGFAGEPTMDDDGNLYFVHHFYEDGLMIEADIYIARRK